MYNMHKLTIIDIIIYHNHPRNCLHFYNQHLLGSARSSRRRTWVLPWKEGIHNHRCTCLEQKHLAWICTKPQKFSIAPGKWWWKTTLLLGR